MSKHTKKRQLTRACSLDRVNPYIPPKPPTTSETEIPGSPPASKSVVFIPLSPKSSATLRRHHEEQATATKSETEDVASESDDNTNNNRDSGKTRRNSDPSSDRPLVSTRRSRDAKNKSETEEDDEEEEVIEMLPDRFDAQGRPLDGSSSSRGGPSQWHNRRGDFEYRSPRGPDGLNMRGEWGVAGTDAETVERLSLIHI